MANEKGSIDQMANLTQETLQEGIRECLSWGPSPPMTGPFVVQWRTSLGPVENSHYSVRRRTQKETIELALTKFLICSGSDFQ